jgi:UDP-glucose 4-epimerase
VTIKNFETSILVTGAAGFIGSNLCEMLLNSGYKVVGIDNLSNGDMKNLNEAIKFKEFNFIQGDICSPETLNSIVGEFDGICHLAALADIVPSINYPDIYFGTNVVGTFNIAQFARTRGIKKIVYSASSSCYGIPTSYPTNETSPIEVHYPYALTKRLGEEILIHWGNLFAINVISLRLFNVYGPRSRTSGNYGAVFGVFLAQKCAQKPLTIVGDGKQTRDFVFVTDVCRAFLNAIEVIPKHQIYNVGSGKAVSILRLAEMLTGDIEFIPKRPGEPDCTLADISLIREDLGWTPKVDIEDGVQIMLDNIDNWQDAPVWDKSKIEVATRDWFKYLGRENEK